MVDLQDLSPRFDVEVFDFLSCPWCFSQEFQARFYRGVVVETPNIDPCAQPIPTITFNEGLEDLFQCQAVQRVVRVLIIHSPGFYQTVPYQRFTSVEVRVRAEIVSRFARPDVVQMGCEKRRLFLLEP